MSITVFIPVFNEEKRIRHALISIQWCDEIIVLDKTSTDRTVEIAKEFGAKVFIMSNSNSYNVAEFKYLQYCTSEWIILLTASDIIDIELANEIIKLTKIENFEYDVINVPYKRYILGLENKRSPWHGNYHPSIFRKSVLKINNDVHGAISFDSKRIYTIKGLKNKAIHHLTHETVDIMMDRHIRYWRAEGNNYNEKNLKKAFRDVLRSLKIIFWSRKTFLLGWDGVALICAYLSYSMMSFVYKWEKKRSTAIETYSKLREQNDLEWEKYNLKR